MLSIELRHIGKVEAETEARLQDSAMKLQEAANHIQTLQSDIKNTSSEILTLRKLIGDHQAQSASEIQADRSLLTMIRRLDESEKEKEKLMQQLEMSRLESKRTLDQLEEARVQSNHQSILHSQLLNKIDIDSSLIQATHEKELSTIRSQLFASQQDKRIAEERLVREMEAMQGTLNMMQNQGRNEDVWKGRCMTMKAEVEALRGERDGLAQQLQAQRLNYNQGPPPQNNQRPRPALAISTANNSFHKGSNGRMF